MVKMAGSEGYRNFSEQEQNSKPSYRCIYIFGSVLAGLSVAVLCLSLYQVLSLQNDIHEASSSHKISWPDPPPYDQVARVARYIVHISDWASMATISVDPKIEGFPFSSVVSLSDGPIGQSSGVPYMFLTPKDFLAADLRNDSRASLSMTEAQSEYCKKMNYDPETPLCGRIYMSGHIVKIAEGSDEEAEAKKAMFSRHPQMKNWPRGHEWFFAKLNISHIYMFDFFGGAADITADEYYAVKPF